MNGFSQGLLALAAGGAAGLVGGYAVLGSAQVPPALDLPPPPAVVAVPELAARVAEKPADVAAAAAPVPSPPAALAPEPPPAATVEAAPGPPATLWDASLVPRGPGRFALLDLQAAGVTTLTVRAGQLARDGAASMRTFANNPRVATLRGPLARVELLHLGFDAEARPVLAHVRVPGTAAEGVVALKQGEIFVPVMRDPEAAAVEPVPAAPDPAEPPPGAAEEPAGAETEPPAEPGTP